MDGTRQLEQDQAYRAAAFPTSSPSILGEGNRVGHRNGLSKTKSKTQLLGVKRSLRSFSSNSAILASSPHDDFLFLKAWATNANVTIDLPR